MITFDEWIKKMGAGASVPYVGQKPGEGSWQGAPGKGKLKSIEGEIPPPKHEKPRLKKLP